MESAPPPAASARAICLAGPTASGKTAVALALARELPLEIISVDSALVYRGMDVGTAKPTAAERAAVPHHLIDILDPLQTYSAARFAADAQRLIAEIQSRGRLPLLVGGTMLYFKALREGLHVMPPADAGVRAELDAQAHAVGWPAMHAELARVDPETAARLAPADAQRIQRALEVWRVSGRPLSQWHRGTAARSSAPALPMISLEPQSRGWLHRRIAERFDTMLAAGLLDEVKALRARGDLHADLPAMRCVGYRQAWAALASGDLNADLGGDMHGGLASDINAELAEHITSNMNGYLSGEIRDEMPNELRDELRVTRSIKGRVKRSVEMSALRESAIAATRQLAKRQLTWLRSTTPRHVVACDAPDALPTALQALRQAIHRAPC